MLRLGKEEKERGNTHSFPSVRAEINRSPPNDLNIRANTRSLDRLQEPSRGVATRRESRFMAPAAQTQAPAVVIIARHGMRLDAADQSWHLSTPTPYDPPLTYGGWNQCQALGVRIASLLHAREQKAEENDQENGNNGRRRRKKHKVVIHTSPFLRCLQTSVAISAGMAQFEEPKDGPAGKRPRTPAQLHSASPRLRGMDSSSSSSHGLAPIAEPRHDLQHDLARRALGHHKRYRKSKIRVDAFLGEWLNPQYFDHITPPPPSPMMVAGAKAELMQNQNVDIFTPSVSHKSSSGSLWSGGSNRSGGSRESPLDDWSHVTNALHAPVPSRDRSNSASSVGSNDSSGRLSPFRPKSPFRHGHGHGHGLQPFTSTIPKPEVAIYRPPRPSYAISNSDYIPRGYVAHARSATVNVDYNWDSSRRPQDWGDGGEFGEEWSSMHRRFRRGLNHIVEWYSHHNADDRGEDALGFEQAEHHGHVDEEEEQEELVVILVTHGAGSNALIGALTNQPVLLDVGMASLTMAVRKDNAPPLTFSGTPDAGSPMNTPVLSPESYDHRRSSLDIGLSAIYDLKLVSSSEHLRQGADPTKGPSTSLPANMKNAHEALSKYKRNGANAHAAAGSGIDSNWDLGEMKRSSSNSSLGSMRRPSAPVVPARVSSPNYFSKSDDRFASPPPVFTTGLWTPPSGRGTPQLSAQKAHEDKAATFSKLSESEGRVSPKSNVNSPPDSRPASAASNGVEMIPSLDGRVENEAPQAQDNVVEEAADGVGDLPHVSEKLPQNLSRGLSQKGLWGRQTSGDKVARKYPVNAPKRRWTVNQHD